MPHYDCAVLDGTLIMPYVGPVRCDIEAGDGRVACQDGRVRGRPTGEYVKPPVSRP